MIRVLALVPDATISNILRNVASYNPGLEWHAVSVRKDAAAEVVEWAASNCPLSIEDRRVIPECPPPPPPGVDSEIFAYEIACGEMDAPGLLWHYWYDWEMLKVAVGTLEGWLTRECDNGRVEAIILWGERCWYNVVAKRVAALLHIPVLHLERAPFPGMLVADSGGFDQGSSTLSLYYALNEMGPAEEVELDDWLPLAAAQTIEPQRSAPMSALAKQINPLPVVLVPLQVPFDTNMVFRTGVAKTNLELVDYATEKYAADHCVLVKMHPADHFTHHDRMFWECQKRGATLIDHGLRDLLTVASHVVSINSQVVVDAAIRGKPFTLLGKPGFWPALSGSVCIRKWLHTLRFRYYIAPHKLTARLISACSI